MQLRVVRDVLDAHLLTRTGAGAHEFQDRPALWVQPTQARTALGRVQDLGLDNALVAEGFLDDLGPLGQIALHQRGEMLHGAARRRAEIEVDGDAGVELNAVEHARHGEVGVVHAFECCVVERIEAHRDAPEAGGAQGGGLLCKQRAVGRERKVDAGADAVVTQLFYENTDFFRFRDQCAKAGISVPIVPGLLPIVNFPQVKRITSLCKARIPSELYEKLEASKDNPESTAAIGIRHAARQAEDLLKAGVPGVHFYVLNQSEATRKVLESLGMGRG